LQRLTVLKAISVAKGFQSRVTNATHNVIDIETKNPAAADDCLRGIFLVTGGELGRTPLAASNQSGERDG